jgi:uncharacterized protein related to proFAR isomerase
MKLSYVIGTEYLVYPDDLPLLKCRVTSLDMKGGRVLFSNRDVDVSRAARDVCSQNIRTVIVLSLDRVGTGAGIDF